MARKRRKARKVKKATEATVTHEGKLTNQVLRQKLRRGKGPVLNLGAALSRKARDSQEIRRGLR